MSRKRKKRNKPKQQASEQIEGQGYTEKQKEIYFHAFGQGYRYAKADNDRFVMMGAQIQRFLMWITFGVAMFTLAWHIR